MHITLAGDAITSDGSGALTVNANYNHAIFSKDDLVITDGTLTVNAVNDGLKGRDAIEIENGALTINAGGDGLQANNDEDSEQGTITIQNGTLRITAGLDDIQAVRSQSTRPTMRCIPTAA